MHRPAFEVDAGDELFDRRNQCRPAVDVEFEERIGLVVEEAGNRAAADRAGAGNFGFDLEADELFEV